MNYALRGLAIFALALTLTACGSDSDDSQVSSDTPDQVDGGGDGGDTGGGDGGDTGGGGGGDTGGDGGAAVPGNLVSYAQSRSDLSTLVLALESAQLTSALSGEGDFTVFAPTNTAFDRLFAELNLTPAQLLGNRELLAQVLRYHVLPARVAAADIPFSQPVNTLDGKVLKLERNPVLPIIYDGRGRLTRITETDLPASNAVIHTIDNVLLPSDKNIVELALARPDLSILAEAVVAADLVETLSAPGPLTVFAPDNHAFTALLSEVGLTKEQLFADKALLRKVLTYHVMAGQMFRAQYAFGEPVATVQGSTLIIDDGFPIRVTDARGRVAHIDSIDTIVTNGVVHILSRVILPAN